MTNTKLLYLLRCADRANILVYTVLNSTETPALAKSVLREAKEDIRKILVELNDSAERKFK